MTKFDVCILGHSEAGKTALLLGLYDYIAKEHKKNGNKIQNVNASEAFRGMRKSVNNQGVLGRSTKPESISYQLDGYAFEITAQTGEYFRSLLNEQHTPNNKLIIIAINPFFLGVPDLSGNQEGQDTIVWQGFDQFTKTLIEQHIPENSAAAEGLNHLFSIDINDTVHSKFKTAIGNRSELKTLIDKYFTDFNYMEQTKNLLDRISKARNNNYMIVITHGDILDTYMKYKYQQTIKVIGTLLSEKMLRNIQVRQIYVSNTIHLFFREGKLLFKFDSDSAEMFHNQILSFVPRQRWSWFPKNRS